jgi:hypothetical protein
MHHEQPCLAPSLEKEGCCNMSKREEVDTITGIFNPFWT